MVGAHDLVSAPGSAVKRLNETRGVVTSSQTPFASALALREGQPQARIAACRHVYVFGRWTVGWDSVPGRACAAGNTGTGTDQLTGHRACAAGNAGTGTDSGWVARLARTTQHPK